MKIALRLRLDELITKENKAERTIDQNYEAIKKGINEELPSLDPDTYTDCILYIRDILEGERKGLNP